MPSIGAISYGAGALLFAVLSALLLVAWCRRRQGALLVATSIASAVWCSASAVHSEFGAIPFRFVEVLELVRDAFWLSFLTWVLHHQKHFSGSLLWKPLFIGGSLVGLCVIAAGLLLSWPIFEKVVASLPTLPLFVHLVLAVAGLVLVEQIYRNTRAEHLWAVKFLCLGVGGFFAYDFYLYSDALLFKQISVKLWNARGGVNAVLVPLIAVSAARNPEWSAEIFVSRHVVFRSIAVLGSGIYLMLMAAAGYYIRDYGGTWGGVAQTVFLFGAVALLAVLLSSGQLRARTKVFLSKHFFKNQYDYREEWLRFTQTLSASEDDNELRENLVRAVTQIVESPGGAMWVEREAGGFYPIASWNTALPEHSLIRDDSSLARFLESTGWVIFLDELADEPNRYPGLEIAPMQFSGPPQPWIIVPLMLRMDLLGFIVISRSATKSRLNWEDADLLKTVGREAASYLEVLKLTEALTDARQFEAFNRLSAFVVHDLKNLIAQLSLIVVNAKKYRGKPRFLDDAFETVENATRKMTHLIAQLGKGRHEQKTDTNVDLESLLRQVLKECSNERPVPALESHGLDIEFTRVNADPNRLAAVLGHLVQNAQEATPADGRVTVRLDSDGEWVIIDVKDNGSGMDAQFVSDRLFRPFDTTKGNAGMGIGVYESREYVREHGGEIEVDSEPGRGTTFRVRLPLAVSKEITGAVDSNAGAVS